MIDFKNKKILCVVNPVSGNREAILAMLAEKFSELDVDWDIIISKKNSTLSSELEKKDLAPYDFLLVYGGDGTIMDFLSYAPVREKNIIILPGGTANVITKELQLPGTTKAALTQLEKLRLTKVDLGKIGDKVFMLRAEIGQLGDSNQFVTREIKNRYGKLAYIISFFMSIYTGKKNRFIVNVDGDIYEEEGVALFVANSGNIGIKGVSMSNSVSITDGKLDVFIFRNLRKYFRHTGKQVLLSKLIEDNQVTHIKGEKIQIIEPENRSVWLDGEKIGKVPQTVEILPGAINVLSGIEKEEKDSIYNTIKKKVNIYGVKDKVIRTIKK